MKQLAYMVEIVSHGFDSEGNEYLHIHSVRETDSLDVVKSAADAARPNEQARVWFRLHPTQLEKLLRNS